MAAAVYQPWPPVSDAERMERVPEDTCDLDGGPQDVVDLDLAACLAMLERAPDTLLEELLAEAPESLVGPFVDSRGLQKDALAPALSSPDSASASSSPSFGFISSALEEVPVASGGRNCVQEVLEEPRCVGEELWQRCAEEIRLMTASAPPSSHHLPYACRDSSLVIFDFDDTLFPTTALLHSGHLYGTNSVSLDAELRTCSIAASRALQTAKRYGRVVIVTNSISGWVEKAINAFMPSLNNDVADVPIISAQSVYQPLGAVSPTSWKSFCFRRVALALQPPSGSDGKWLKELVSIGDSWGDRASAIWASRSWEQPLRVKSVKLMASPSIEDVARQLTHCAQHLGWLMGHEDTLDVVLDQNGEVQPVAESGQQKTPAGLGLMSGRNPRRRIST